MELEEAVKTIRNFIDYFNKNKCDGNKANLEVLGEEKEAMDFILNHITKQEKLIELMVEYLEDELTDDICNKENCYADEYINGHCQKCLNCVKQYFEKKAEKSE